MKTNAYVASESTYTSNYKKLVSTPLDNYREYDQPSFIVTSLLPSSVRISLKKKIVKAFINKDVLKQT